MTAIIAESRFTPAHRACDHPEHWTAYDSESTELEVVELVAAFVRALQPEYVVETGSCYGYTSRAIGRALETNGHGICHSLEVDPGRAAIAAQRVEALPVVVYVTDSLVWEPAYSIDLAFFDSSYEARTQEFLRFAPSIATGAICIFHDTASAERGHHYDMRAAVQELVDDKHLDALYLRTPRGVAICQKR